jgi:hypothetical protein
MIVTELLPGSFQVIAQQVMNIEAGGWSLRHLCSINFAEIFGLELEDEFILYQQREKLEPASRTVPILLQRNITRTSRAGLKVEPSTSGIRL